jgi:3-oxoacyl-[acyl-carrier protein] reductase
MTYPELRGRVVLITGTNNDEGIGQAIARAFAAQGARLLLTYRPVPPDARAETPPPEPGDERYAWLNAGDPLDLVETLRAEGAEVEVGAYDHALPDSADAVVDWARAVFGTIDVIVSNAAACEADSFAYEALLTADSCDHHHAVNVRFPALLLRRFAGLRRERGAGGSFIAISTDASDGHAGQASYAGSKHSYESYVRTAAWSWAPSGSGSTRSRQGRFRPAISTPQWRRTCSRGSR